MSTCSPWANMQKSPWWPLRPTYGYGVKGKKKGSGKVRVIAMTQLYLVQFSFFQLTVCTIFTVTFSRKPHEIGQLVLKILTAERCQKQYETKDIFCFVWLYLKINISDFRLILLDHITYHYYGIFYQHYFWLYLIMGWEELNHYGMSRTQALHATDYFF